MTENEIELLLKTIENYRKEYVIAIQRIAKLRNALEHALETAPRVDKWIAHAQKTLSDDQDWDEGFTKI